MQIVQLVERSTQNDRQYQARIDGGGDGELSQTEEKKEIFTTNLPILKNLELHSSVTIYARLGPPILDNTISTAIVILFLRYKVFFP